MAPESFGKNSTRAPEAGRQRLDNPQGVSIQKLKESIAKIQENRNQIQRNSTIELIQPKQTKEIRGN